LAIDVTKRKLKFEYTTNPFSFRVRRRDTGETLFDSSAAPLVFEDQYIRLRTHLPDNPNLYGLGEHADSFRLPTTNYSRTLWNVHSESISPGSNLYGSHPVYLDHRPTGSHGVFLLNANGMDIVIDKNEQGQYLEYNIIGGVLDFYFMAGPSPVDVAKQYARIAGRPAPVQYSGLGFHHARWGYRDFFELAEVIQNYTRAGIPVESYWVDKEHMHERIVRPPLCWRDSLGF
jgi:alpha-glucosidase